MKEILLTEATLTRFPIPSFPNEDQLQEEKDTTAFRSGIPLSSSILPCTHRSDDSRYEITNQLPWQLQVPPQACETLQSSLRD